MNFFDVLKGVLSIIVDIGTGVVVGHYTGAAVSSAKGIEKVCAGVASVAIGGYVGSKAAEWMNSQVDQVQNKLLPERNNGEEPANE